MMFFLKFSGFFYKNLINRDFQMILFMCFFLCLVWKLRYWFQITLYSFNKVICKGVFSYSFSLDFILSEMYEVLLIRIFISFFCRSKMYLHLFNGGSIKRLFLHFTMFLRSFVKPPRKCVMKTQNQSVPS